MYEDYEIRVFFSGEDAGYIAEAPELDGCSAFGDTPEEALAQLRIAIRLWLDSASESGAEAPLPRLARS